jgi:hypothetical protein
MPDSVEVKLKTRFSLASNEQSEKSLSCKLDELGKIAEATSQQDQQTIRIDVLNAHLDSNSQLETQKKVIEKWNKITTCLIGGKKVFVNRISWMTKNGKPHKYVYDSMGFPL